MNRYLKAFLPYGIVRVFQKLEKYRKQKLPPEIKSILQVNEKFKDIHKGERCFIVGTGPSISSQDLLPLKNEIVFSLSRFYYHSQYGLIKPKYQVISGLALHPVIYEKPDLPYLFYKEAESKILSEVIFTHFGDREFIHENFLFDNQKIAYFYPGSYLKELEKSGIDLTQRIYNCYFIPELAIQIAIYMGFSEIILLGLDHSWLKEVVNDKNWDTQFYEKNVGVFGETGNSEFVVEHQQSKFPLRRWISIYEGFNNNYSMLNSYCNKRGIKIFNATKGGMLEVFERINYEKLFK